MRQSLLKQFPNISVSYTYTQMELSFFHSLTHGCTQSNKTILLKVSFGPDICLLILSLFNTTLYFQLYLPMFNCTYLCSIVPTYGTLYIHTITQMQVALIFYQRLPSDTQLFTNELCPLKHEYKIIYSFSFHHPLTSHTSISLSL